MQIIRSEINGQRVPMRIGVLPEERGVQQEVLVSVRMSQAVDRRINDLSDCLDYGALSEKIARLAELPHTDLLETVAQRLLDEILQDPRVIEAEVSMHKPHIVPSASSVGITVRGTRKTSSSVEIVLARQRFFDQIVTALSEPPGKVDEIFAQHVGARNVDVVVNDPGRGNLVIRCVQQFSSRDACEYIYSVYALGRHLKIGLFIRDPSYVDAPNRGRGDNILKHVWGDDCCVIMRGDGFLYEWSFIVDPLDDLDMEWYAQGMRNLHMQVGIVMSDANFLGEAGL